jgi:protein phosphatase
LATVPASAAAVSLAAADFAVSDFETYRADQNVGCGGPDYRADDMTAMLALGAANEWLWAQHGRWPDHDSVVAAVSVLVLRDRRYYLAHVGDTRVYRLRGSLFQQLTTDHTWQRRDMRHVLRRAVGLDSHLVVDFADGDLEDGDTFLMATDGVWEVLGDASMIEILRHRLDQPEAAAGALVDAAQRHQAAYMGRNDATALVFRIRSAL